MEAARLPPKVEGAPRVEGAGGGAMEARPLESAGLSRLGTLRTVCTPSRLTERRPESWRSGEGRRGPSGVLPAELLPLGQAG